MSTSTLGIQTKTSTQLVPPTVTAETTTKHQITPPTALTKNYLAKPPRKPQKQKQPLTFCPTCKMLLHTVEKCPPLLKCKKCGYRTEQENNVIVDEKISARQINEIAVIDKEKADLHTHPTVQAICEKCGKTESETWTIAVGSEGTTGALTFLRCINCGFTRREVG